MKVSRVMKSIGLGIATLSLSTVAVGIAGSAAWASSGSGSSSAISADSTPGSRPMGRKILVLSNTAVAVNQSSAGAINTLVPMTASGCTGFVTGLSGQFGICIGVNGSGTDVSTISASAYALYDGCSAAQIVRNGEDIKQAPTVCYGNSTTLCWGEQSDPTCGTFGTMLSADFGFYSSSWFHYGDKVCARYVAEPDNGRMTYPFSWNDGLSTPEACETIL